MSDQPPAGAPDLWAEVVGQDDAVAQLRAAAADPVHAYLLVGPPGSGRREAARAFAADLLTDGLPPEGVERGRRLCAEERHPALVVVERTGAAISADEAREVVRIANLSPPEGDRQVVLLLDVHVLRPTDAAGIVLKTIEEPPVGTVFVLVGEELPNDLSTIASRCVRVDFGPVPTAAVVGRLAAEGVARDRAELVAATAGGSLARARLLARDEHLAARRELWRAAPDRLDGTGAAAASVVEELVGSIDEVLAPLLELHAEEVARLEEQLEAYELRGKGQLKAMDARHKREQRRVRTDELLAGLRAVTDRYRDALVEGLDAGRYAAAASAVQRVCDDLRFNPNERLALLGLFTSLPAIAAPGRS